MQRMKSEASLAVMLLFMQSSNLSFNFIFYLQGLSAVADAHHVLEMGQEEEETELVIEDETAIMDSGNSNASINGNSSPEGTGTGPVSRTRLVGYIQNIGLRYWLKFLIMADHHHPILTT